MVLSTSELEREIDHAITVLRSLEKALGGNRHGMAEAQITFLRQRLERALGRPV
jgi:hypothetical protein